MPDANRGASPNPTPWIASLQLEQLSIQVMWHAETATWTLSIAGARTSSVHHFAPEEFNALCGILERARGHGANPVP